MTAVSDPVRPDLPDSSRRPDYEALARPEGPVPESAAWNILAYLLAGLIGFGLPAWFVDQWLGTSWIVLIGILLGTAVAMMTIWFRYGTGEDSQIRTTSGASSSVRGATSSPKPAQQDARPAPDAIPLEDKP